MNITLIIPIYNAERHLPACLDSLRAQTLRDFRVLLVDDGSTDASADICRTYVARDERFTLLQQPNRGVSAARNVGIDAAPDGYIGFVDADDCLYPEALEVLYAGLQRSGAQVCVGGFDLGAEYPHPGHQTVAADVPLTWVKDYVDTMRVALYQRYPLNAPWGMLMERRLLGEDIRFREGIRYEDLDAFYRFYERATAIAYIDRPLYFYRQDASSFIHTWSADRLDVLDVTDRIVDYMRDRYPALLPAALDRQFSAHYNMLLLALRHGGADTAVVQRTWAIIHARRRSELTDPHVRLKNRLGALAAYGGLPVLRLLARL